MTRRQFYLIALIIITVAALYLLVRDVAADEPLCAMDGESYFCHDGSAPAAPEAWGGATSTQPGGMYSIGGLRDPVAWVNYKAVNGAHTAECGSPGIDNGQTHPVVTYEDGIYHCKGHWMTAVGSPGYGAIFMTPEAVLDWSNGPATIEWDMSTWRTSHRDWVSIVIAPYGEYIPLPITGAPDGQGMPPDSLEFKRVLNNWEWSAEGYSGGTFIGGLYRPSADYWRYGLSSNEESICYGPVATNRIHFKITISSAILRVERPFCGGTIYQTSWSDASHPLPFSSGVVTFIHHSYSPDKAPINENGASPNAGQPNTWHWDNFRLTPATPFTSVGVDTRQVIGTRHIAFDAPAPAGAELIFGGRGDVQVSWDGIAYTPAAQPPSAPRGGPTQEHNYRVPVPEGAQGAWIRTGPVPDSQDHHAHGFVVWATGVAPSPTPTATASPSPTPSPTTSPSPTPSPSPTATPSPSPSPTPTPSPTPSPSPTPTPTPTPTATPSPTPSPEPTATPEPECRIAFFVGDEMRWAVQVPCEGAG